MDNLQNPRPRLRRPQAETTDLQVRRPTKAKELSGRSAAPGTIRISEKRERSDTKIHRV